MKCQALLFHILPKKKKLYCFTHKLGLVWFIFIFIDLFCLKHKLGRNIAISNTQ